MFSGETGAGKSILVDALALALGERGDASVLREGAARADISAVFDTPATLRPWLAEREFDADEELALRRVIDAQGRSRAYINGTPATVAQLRELGDSLVDIHGQHAHQSLMRPDAQRDLLDAHGGHGELRQAVGQAWKLWRALARQLEAAEKTPPAWPPNANACNGRWKNSTAWTWARTSGTRCSPNIRGWRTHNRCWTAPARSWKRWTATATRPITGSTRPANGCSRCCATIPACRAWSMRSNRPASPSAKPCPT